MRRLMILLGLLALLGAACSDGGGSTASGDTAAGPGDVALAQGGDGDVRPPGPGVTVVGEGEISGRPDTLTATVGVEVQRDSVDAAIAEANERAQAVIDAVVGAGVAEEDVRTRDFSVRPQHGPHRPEGGEPDITGYVASNLLRVEVTDVDRAGEVLDAAVDAGGDAARVHGVSFELRDNAQLLEAAREAAFDDARGKAEQYASLADRDLGDVVSVSEQVSTPPGPQPFATGGAVAEDTAQARAPIEPGQQAVTVRVTVVWSLG